MYKIEINNHLKVRLLNYTLSYSKILALCGFYNEDGVGTPVSGDGGQSSPNESTCGVVAN